jgi:PAS domain S-box-containing protein
VATFLSALLVDHFFVEPRGSLIPETAESLVSLAFFTILGGAIGEVTARFRVAQSFVHIAAREAVQRAEELQDQAMELELQTEEAQTLTEQLAQTNEELDAARVNAESHSQQLQLVLDTLPDATNVYDAEWRWTYINPVAAGLLRSLGKDPAGLIGKVIWEELPSLATTLVHSESWRALRERRSIEFEEHIDALDRWFENRVVPGDGSIVTYSRDITDRKRAELALRDSERRFRRMFDENPLPMWVFDMESLDFLAVNDAACAHYGYSRREFFAMTLRDVRRPEEIPELESALRAARRGQPVRGLHRHRRKDGSEMDVEVSSQEIDYEGRRARLAIIIDVTDRELLFQTEREARAEAELANQAKTGFLATMSHELRTPLNAIAGYAELLEVGIHGPVTDKQRESLSRIQRSQRHLLSLINDVLNFAKLSAGRVEYEITDVPVRVAVQTVEELMSAQFQAKSLTLSRANCENDVRVRADGEKVQQILLNLLSNAVKFTGAGGTVTMSCAAHGGVVSIRVTDTGIGIPPDRLTQIFEPFVQVDRRLNSRHEGTGLGLAISRDLAKAMGGDITVESELGVGSTFTVTLPGA